MFTIAEVREATATAIEDNSGHTFTPLPGRYIVGLPGGQKFDARGGGDFEAITAYVLEVANRATLEENKACEIRMNNGTLHVYVSESYDDLETALSVGTARGELAIWDAVEQHEYNCG